MRIELTIDEILALARAAAPLPPVVADVRAADDGVHVTLDLRELPGVTGAQRIAVRMAGTAEVVARLHGFADGVATLDLDVAVRGLPVDRLVGLLGDRLVRTLEAQGVPCGAVTLVQQPELAARVDVQHVLAERVTGVRLTSLEVDGGRVRGEIDLGAVTLR
ncbi:hypothetical protein GXB85_15890 [Cellulomonas sp. APG4]|uniref:hypothetical protein n=1 Tax=Cellulomonas sp. APG4 TaxID=1538656 RepID=UPI00137965F2|nr:hypothetical protein [Cellulomonas sp. APG4]NCT92417.1 hypothetical protein [Cellulomonas sp. APG4]